MCGRVCFIKEVGSLSLWKMWTSCALFLSPMFFPLPFNSNSTIYNYFILFLPSPLSYTANDFHSFSFYSLSCFTLSHWCSPSPSILPHFPCPSSSSRLPRRCVPEEAVPRPHGKLQSAGKTRPKRLCAHRGGTRPHAATNHWRGECVSLFVSWQCAEVEKNTERKLCRTLFVALSALGTFSWIFLFCFVYV